MENYRARGGMMASTQQASPCARKPTPVIQECDIVGKTPKLDPDCLGAHSAAVRMKRQNTECSA